MARINENNINSYLKKNYNITDIKKNEEKIIANVPSLLQKNYGGSNDCALTSLTAIISYYAPNLKIEDIYNQVEKSARKYLFSNTFGTFTFFNKHIFNDAVKALKINKKATRKLFKNIGFDFNFIKEKINQNIPINFSITKDGNDDFYNNHSITIIGYSVINGLSFLIVYDNWSKNYSYVDFEKIRWDCEICYTL